MNHELSTRRDNELAAALVAVDAFLRAESGERAAAPAPDRRTNWRASAMLRARGLPADGAGRSGWSIAERLRRGAGGFYGVIGL